MFNILSGWYKACYFGELFSILDYAESIENQVPSYDSGTLWPACYLPSSINDASIYNISCIRRSFLVERMSSHLSDSLFSSFRAKSNPLFITNTSTTHINGFSLSAVLNNIGFDCPSIFSIPAFPDVLHKINDHSELLDYYLEFYDLFFNQFSFYLKSILRSGSSFSHIIDTSFGTLDSVEGLFVNGPRIYHQQFGFHFPNILPFNSNNISSYVSNNYQDWLLSGRLIALIAGQVTSLDHLPRVRILFPCAFYKYSPSFWRFIVQLSHLDRISQIGLFDSKIPSRTLPCQLQDLGATISKVDVISPKSTNKLLNYCHANYDFALDMYLNGGSSVTPLLLKSGFPVFHQPCASVFSKVQMNNYNSNGLSFLIRNDIPFFPDNEFS